MKARPTIYAGITMRSRLEADFAGRYLDRPGGSFGPWEYEPVCFGGKAGQYLPDFRTRENEQPTYHELKPYSRGILDRQAVVDVWLSRMTIIWDSEPSATLILHFWQYGGPEPASIVGIAGSWRICVPPLGMFVWPGMGQEEALLGAQKVGAWLRVHRKAAS